MIILTRNRREWNLITLENFPEDSISSRTAVGCVPGVLRIVTRGCEIMFQKEVYTMTEMINALLLKYKREAACPRLGASHKTVVVTLTYHHQQIIILGHHRHHHQYSMGNSARTGGRQEDGLWSGGSWLVVKIPESSPPSQHSQDREKCICGCGLLTLMTSIS